VGRSVRTKVAAMRRIVRSSVRERRGCSVGLISDAVRRGLMRWNRAGMGTAPNGADGDRRTSATSRAGRSRRMGRVSFVPPRNVGPDQAENPHVPMRVAMMAAA
jgi:hypothetical protein